MMKKTFSIFFDTNKILHAITCPLLRVNPGSIFGWGLIFIFGGLVNLFF
jgi:hypothetical protein